MDAAHPAGRDGLAELRAIVGDDHARDAGPEDRVDGVQPRWVAEPGSAEEASALIRFAHCAGLRVAPRGGGTKLGWGAPPEALDLVASTRRLDRLVEHAAGDLVATVQAGARLDAVQTALAGAGQMLALDPPELGATIGGVIAANASGPLRLRYGTVKDLLIGITVVLADGTVAKAGGKVVKNIAGYDLAKLFTGSLGTLGLIVEATFRLHPRPAAERRVVLALRTPEQAGAATQALLHSSLVPSSIDLLWPVDGGGGVLSVRFEGIEPGVVAQAAAAAEQLRPFGMVRAADGDGAPLSRDERDGDDGVTLKLSIPPAELHATLEAVLGAARRGGTEARVAGHVGNGVLRAVLPTGDLAATAGAIREIRDAVEARGGSAVVLRAPLELKQQVDVWGSAGNALPLMRRIKQRFDPARILNPGRFIGGI